MRKLARLPFLLATTLALGLTNGCTHLPTQPATSYANAFTGVGLATEELLADYDLAVRHLSASPDKSIAPPAYPVQFDPAAVLRASPEDPVIAQYRRALDALTAYNDSLLALVQGGPDTAIDQHAQFAASLLDAFGAGSLTEFPGGGDMVRALLSSIARAHNRAQLQKAVEVGAPTVAQLLDALTAATADFYRVRVGCIGDEITEVEYQHETVFAQLRAVAQECAAPAPGSEYALRRAQVESEAYALHRAFAPNAPMLPLPVGAAPYDDRAQSRLEEQLNLLRAISERRRTLSEQLSGYHACLTQYVRLIGATKVYFADLRAALDSASTSDASHAGRDLQTDANTLLRSLRELRASLALSSTSPKPEGN